MTYPTFSRRLTLAMALLVGGSGSICAAQSPVAAAPAAPNKIWTSPPGKLYVQTLTDRIMAAHPELLSVTFHGVPPGAAPKTYTMFGGSYPERIGNPDDPDDEVQELLGHPIFLPDESHHAVAFRGRK